MRTAAPVAGASPGTAAPDLGAQACGTSRVRCLSPILYAVDTVVPIINLGQRTTWYPGRGRAGIFMTWLLDLCTILGWGASTIFALSFTRLGRNPTP